MAVKVSYLLFLLVAKCFGKPSPEDSFPATTTEPTPTEQFGNVWKLDVQGNYWLFWKTNATHVIFETHVKTKGYVGFGLSSNGKMFPSDVVIGWIDSNGTTHFKDCHTEGHYAPIIDASQDWFLLLGKENNFGTVLKFIRKLDTCDDNDYLITESTVKVIYSYHPDDPASFSSLSWHGAERRGAKSLMLLSSVKANEYVPPSDAEQFDMLHHNFHVPAKETTYQCTVFKVPHKPQKYHMIRYEPIISPGNEDYVHHILVYNCPTATDADNGKVFDCYGHRPRHLDCSDVVIAWAVGGVAFDFPSNAGYSFMTPGDPQYLIMETHFNNPTLKSGIIDSSGIRITATHTIRQHDAGVLQAGAIVNKLQFVPPHEKDFLSRHSCSQQCLQKALVTQQNSMKAFATILHSHLLGSSIVAHHIRGDVELEPLAQDLSYDFNYQDTRVFPKEREIKYGDSLTIDCHYDSTGRTKPTLGGLSTAEEMCLAFIYYYPKTEISNCLSSPLYDQIGSNPYHNVDTMYSWNWQNQDVKNKFKDILNKTNVYHKCSSHTHRESTHYQENVYRVPEPKTTYTPPPRQCPGSQ
ncbi:DBH-like monooxygenase protein 1 homolog [Mytilus californianus]|uniref:DBH-like monooxygenase protein 1 homolog n=1 Tax=Mytilus californianus TaxID=6549 RepID=UPI0022479823|nr:DBH-like monooxygenase protein 1 homolog [Mytilus californianus]